MHYDNHSTLRYINKAPKIILWDAGEAMSFCVPFALLVITGHLLWGILVGWVTIMGIRFVKTLFGVSTLVHVAYWYLPTPKSVYRVYIPSHIREFIG